jgi:hypothetical protein
MDQLKEKASTMHGLIHFSPLLLASDALCLCVQAGEREQRNISSFFESSPLCLSTVCLSHLSLTLSLYLIISVGVGALLVAGALTGASYIKSSSNNNGVVETSSLGTSEKFASEVYLYKRTHPSGDSVQIALHTQSVYKLVHHTLSSVQLCVCTQIMCLIPLILMVYFYFTAMAVYIIFIYILSFSMALGSSPFMRVPL